jgi:oligoribonuclease
LTSRYSHDYVANAVFDYIKKWIPNQRVGVLAGNSVHADRSFLVEEMPEVIDWLHYRSLSPPSD